MTLHVVRSDFDAIIETEGRRVGRFKQLENKLSNLCVHHFACVRLISRYRRSSYFPRSTRGNTPRVLKLKLKKPRGTGLPSAYYYNPHKTPTPTQKKIYTRTRQTAKMSIQVEVDAPSHRWSLNKKNAHSHLSVVYASEQSCARAYAPPGIAASRTHRHAVKRDEGDCIPNDRAACAAAAAAGASATQFARSAKANAVTVWRS